MSWDCQVPGDLVEGGSAWALEEALDENPYLQTLFIAKEGSPGRALTPRQALLAWCTHKARHQSGLVR